MKNNKYGLTITSIKKYGFKKALEVFEKYGHKCSVCESSDYLAIHHIDGKGRHNKEKGLQTNDDINNLQLICRKCHGSLHAKKYWDAHRIYTKTDLSDKKNRKLYMKLYMKRVRETNREEYNKYHKMYKKKYRAKLTKGEV